MNSYPPGELERENQSTYPSRNYCIRTKESMCDQIANATRFLLNENNG